MSTRWYIHRRGRVQCMPEAQIRDLLRGGQLTGLELARPEGSDEWKPLHDCEFFRAEVPALRGDAAATAIWRAGRVWIVHLLVLMTFGAYFDWPRWMAWWGLAAALHGLQVLTYLRPFFLRIASPSEQEPVRLTSAVDADPFVAAIEDAVGDLQRHAADAQQSVPDLDGLKTAALELHRRRIEMERLFQPNLFEELDADTATARRKAADATDARTAEEWERQADAAAERRKALDDLLKTADRLELRERTLLHQVEGLRLALARAGAEAGEVPDLVEKTRLLRHEAEAAAEVDEALARVRRQLGARARA